MAASEAYLAPVPQQHQHQTIHRARHGAGDDHRPRDREHLHHRARDKPLCLSQVKHKYLVNRCLSGKQDGNVEFAAQCGGNAFQSGY